MEELFNGGGWKITQETATLPDGRVAKRTRASYADTVHLLAVNEEGKLLVLREYRPFYKAHIWMLPSGHVDKEKDHAIAADRELREETGFKATTLLHLWSAHSSEKLKSANHFYLAKDLTHDPLPQDEDEMIEVHALTPQEAYENIVGSKNVHIASAYGVLRYMHDKKK